MADNTIDTLDIQISSSTEKAVRALTNLSNKLTKVNSALSGVNTNGLRSYARELGRVTSAFNSLGNVRTSGLDSAISKLNTLSKINLSNLQNQKISIDLDISRVEIKHKNCNTPLIKQYVILKLIPLPFQSN